MRRSGAGRPSADRRSRSSVSDSGLLHSRVGISTRWSARSVSGGCICGAASMTKVRSLASWSSPGETQSALRSCSSGCCTTNQVEPQTNTTDGLASYGAALDQLDLSRLHRLGRLRKSNQVENSRWPLRRRERQQQRFKSQASARISSPHTHQSTTPLSSHLISRMTLRRSRAKVVSVWAAAVA